MGICCHYFLALFPLVKIGKQALSDCMLDGNLSLELKAAWNALLDMGKRKVSMLIHKKLSHGAVFKCWHVGNSMLEMHEEIPKGFSSSHIKRLFI